MFTFPSTAVVGQVLISQSSKDSYFSGTRISWLSPLGLIVLAVLTMLLSPSAGAQISIVTERYDTSRTGANLNETILNTSNVNVNQFGKLYSYVVDGSIQAQPLYVPNVSIPGKGAHNVLYVVTMNDVLYAFDADSSSSKGGILWSLDFRNPSGGVTPIPIADIVQANNLNIVGNVGIESTPVIDLTSNTLYLVARTKEVSGTITNYVARLHAIDITNGSEKFGGPVTINASVPGSGLGSSGGTLVFDTLHQNQRSSLALVGGMVLFSWASHEDLYAWHGWVMAYNAQTLAQSSVYCSTPNGSWGGIWMAGRAPVVDGSGNVYYASGNGDWDGTSSFGDSVLKLSTTGGTLSLVDYFTPDDYAALESGDQDLGSSGPLLIPGTNLLLHGGKTSIFYLMKLSSLGHEQSGNNQIVQNFTTTGSEIHGGPVFWNRTTGAGPTMYVWPDDISLQGYQFNGSVFNTTPISQSTLVAPQGSSGGVLTISANGSTPGTGVVWSSMPLNANGDHGTVQGVLRAFDANSLTNELWDSTMNDARDDIGLWPKYSPPVVVNGKVYMASFSGVLNVYGLLSPQDFAISASPSNQSVAPGNSASYTVSATALNGFSGSVSLSVSGLPSGATASFNPTSIGGGASSTLTVTTATTTPTGSPTLTITGTSGSLSHSITVTLTVTGSADFTVSATPSTASVSQGSSTPYTVNVGALNGFSGSVSLSVSGLPSGATASFNPTSIGGGASSTLTVTTAATTPTGSPTLTITGTSGSLSHSTTVTLTVTTGGSSSAKVISIDFVGSGTAMGSSEVAGVVAKSNWNDATGASSSSPLGLVNETGSATTATVSWQSDNVWSLPISDQPGNVRMMEGYLDNGSGDTTTVTVSGLPPNTNGYSVYVYADGDNTVGTNSASRTGIYQISGTGITTTSISLTDPANTNFSGTFTQANNSNGNYVVFTINSTGFTLSAIPSTASDGHQRAPLNGIQIVPVSGSNPDFTVSATPSTASVSQGSSTHYTVNVGALNGFSGSVSLSVSGLPSGATASFNPTSIGGGASSTLTVTTATTTPTGSPTLTITGTSGSLSHSITVTLTVTGSADFTVSATPSTASVSQGSSTPYTVNVGALNGFSGSVSLSVSGLPSGATASFNPTSIGGGASSTLTVTTAATTPTGSPTLTITGTSGSLSHSTTVTLTVTTGGSSSAKVISIDFVGSGTAMGSSEVAGVVAKSNWNDATGASSSSPLGLVNETGSATTATVSWQSDNVWSLPISDQPGNVRMMEGYLDNGSGDTTTVTVSGLPPNTNGYSVYVYADGDNTVGTNSASRTGIYQISGTGITTTSISLTDPANTNFSGTFTQANNSNGNYVVFTINSTGFTLSAIPSTASDGHQRAPLNGIQIVPVSGSNPDFTVSATPSTASVSQGSSTHYTVNVGALNGFSGSVSLSVSGLPSGATASFNPTSIGGGASSTLTVTTATTTPTGSPTLTITGTSGSLSHSITVTLTVTGSADFTVSATPSTASVSQGSSTPYTVNVGALNGFSGSVSLSVSGLPSGATASFNPTSIGGGASSTLTVTTAATTPTGSPTLTITGTSGSLSHSTTVTLTVTTGGSSSAKVISIDFVGSGTAMGSSEVAGVVAKSNWNDATGASSSSPLGLVNETGSATTATVSWQSDNVWSLPISDQPGNVRMMEGYLDNGSGDTTTVTVSGLPPNTNGYSVYVYADGDNTVGTNSASRTGIYQISGTGITTTSISLTDPANTNFSGTFTQANNSNGNYVVFTINSTGFTLSAIPSTASDGHQRAPLNGIQIVPR